MNSRWKHAGMLGEGIAVAVAVFAWRGDLHAEDPGKPKDGKFIGAGKCKNCHQATKAGNQYAKWQKMEHRKAFGVLAGDEAKKLAKERGIDDPQKSEKCLKCHVTAFEEPAARLSKGFDPKLGVQCETCHGPGEKHFKARMAAAGGEEEDAGFGGAEEEKVYQKIPEGEIVTSPTVETCLKCHNNKEGPESKPLCMTKAFEEVMHFDPRKKRTDAELAEKRKKMEEDLKARESWCGGPEKCEECKKAQ